MRIESCARYITLEQSEYDLVRREGSTQSVYFASFSTLAAANTNDNVTQDIDTLASSLPDAVTTQVKKLLQSTADLSQCLIADLNITINCAKIDNSIIGI